MEPGLATKCAALATLLSLGACASAPAPLQGQFADLLPAEASRTGAAAAGPLRWGGRIVKVEPQASRSCFEIVGQALDRSGRPVQSDRSEGRFLACRAGFYDPEVFRANREITVTGRLAGYEQRRIGDYDYRYPRLDAEAIYLWPERRDIDVIVERVPYW
jgi:outer membrane lipoprotein